MEKSGKQISKKAQPVVAPLLGAAAASSSAPKRRIVPCFLGPARRAPVKAAPRSTNCSPLIVEVPKTTCTDKKLPEKNQPKKNQRKRKNSFQKGKAKKARYQDDNDGSLGAEREVLDFTISSTPKRSGRKKGKLKRYLQKRTQKLLKSQKQRYDEEASSSHHHSTPLTKTPNLCEVPLSPLKFQGGHLAVALVKAHSVQLKREGVFIGLFLRDSVVCFQGRVQMRVLAGLVNVEGYIYKPSTCYHHLYSPIGHPAVTVSALNPDMQDADFECYFAPLRSKSGVHFHSLHDRDSRCVNRDGCVFVDLDKDDVAMLDVMTKSAYKRTIAVVLFKPLCTNVTSLLHQCTSPSVFNVESRLIDGFQTLAPNSISTTPAVFKQIAWDVLNDNKVKSLLVCGGQGTGKSTLCRYLINYFLNRYTSVCYLECDVGQPEFTVPEVLSLHVVSEPITGPPYTHQRKAFKSYFYGDNSPRADPEYYLKILKTLHRHFTNEVKISDRNIPLIVNTCGWTSGMGEALLLELIRSLNPSHIVRLVGMSSKDNEMPPFTENFLINRPAVSITPSTDLKFHIYGHVCPLPSNLPMNDSSCAVGHSLVNILEESYAVHGESGMEGSELEDSEEASIVSEENVSSLTDSISESLESSFSSTPTKEKRVKMAAKLSGKKLQTKSGNFKQSLKCHANEKGDKMGEEFHTEGWQSVLSHRVIYVQCIRRNKRSSNLRKLALVAYLNPLFDASLSVAMEFDMPNPHNNMLCYAPPLVVPWNDVAVHILHRNVPRDQTLYALNGQFVALGSVESDEIIVPTSGTLKFLKSCTPIIEFVGLGLLRGIDIDKKLFYLTTPECSEQLERVNVLVLGNTEKLPAFTKDTVQGTRAPYHLKGYQPAEGGQYAWSTRR